MALIVFWAAADLSGQQPRRRPEPYVAPLLPAEPAWLVTLPAPPAAGGALDAWRVYIPLQDDALVALDRETGETLWTSQIDSAWPPVAGDGMVYVAAGDAVHAVDAASGDPGWRAPIEGGAMAPMILSGRLLLVPLKRGELVALQAGTGEVVWRCPLGDTTGDTSGIRMNADEASVYLTLTGGRVVSIALADGQVRWERTLPGILSQPALARDRVFIGSSNNFFYALDADTGALEWQWQYGGDVIGAVADGDVVYVASLDNIVRAVNRGNGNQRWKQETGTRPLAPPLAFGGVVVVIGVSPAMTTFVAKTGKTVSSYEAPARAQLQGPPLIDPTLRPLRVAMVAIMRDGRVTGLRPVPMMFREKEPEPLTVLPGRPLPREARP